MKFSTLLMAGTALFLSGCGSTDSANVETSKAEVQAEVEAEAEKIAQEVSEERAERITRARQKVVDNHPAVASIAAAERAYKKEPHDPMKAIAYSRALREKGFVQRAELILKPFADDHASPGATKTEFSALQLAQGNYKIAEQYAQQAIIQDPQDFRAYHNLGISLDALSMHVEAERAFRKGLETWQGDPTAIMNNLALNLTSQGEIDEAVEILERAKKLSPQKMEIERNLRIVRALQETYDPAAFLPDDES